MSVGRFQSSIRLRYLKPSPPVVSQLSKYFLSSRSALFFRTAQTTAHSLLSALISSSMAARPLSKRLLYRASQSFRNFSQPAQARTVPLRHPPHRQSPRWRPSPPPSWRPQIAESHYTVRGTVADSRTRFLLSYQDLERALQRRGLKSSRALLAGAAAVAVGFALAWPRIKQWGAAEGAEVAAASLEQERLQERAAAMVHEVLSDPRTGEQVEQLLKVAVINLFQDEEFTAKAVDWTSQVLGDALTWESVRQRGTEYVESVFSDDVSKQSAQAYLKEAVSTVVADETVQDTVANGLWAGVRASMFGRRKRPSSAEVPAVAAVTVETPESDKIRAREKAAEGVPEQRKRTSQVSAKESQVERIPVQAASVANGVSHPEEKPKG